MLILEHCTNHVRSFVCMPELHPPSAQTEVERRQEGDHSIVSRACANRQVSGPYVSCVLRMREITPIFESEDDSRVMVECYGSIQNPDDMAKRLHFWRHHMYQEAVQENKGFKAKRQLASCLLYSLDTTAQHAQLQANRKKREQARNQQQKQVAAYRKRQEQPTKLSLQDTLEQAVGMKHLEEFVSGQSRRIMLSVPADASASFRTLDASLSRAPRPGLPLVATDNCEQEAGEAHAHQSLSFFKLVPVRLQQQRLMRLPAVSTRRLSKREICVTQHASHTLDEQVIVSLEPQQATTVANPVHVLSVCRVGWNSLRDNLQAWTPRKGVRNVLTCLSDSVAGQTHAAIDRLVAARAFQASDNILQIAGSEGAMRDQLVLLESCKVVECLHQTPHESRWRFSALGSAHLRVANVVQNPRTVFAALKAFDLPSLQDASCWQLFTALCERGFRVLPRPASKRKLSLLTPHSRDAVNLVWYAAATSTLESSKLYMISLLHSPDLFENGILTRLHHCQPLAYYESVLEGRSAGSPLQELLDEEKPPPPLELDADPSDQPLVVPADTAQEERPRKRARQAVLSSPAEGMAIDEGVEQASASVKGDCQSHSDSLSLSSEGFLSDVEPDVAPGEGDNDPEVSELMRLFEEELGKEPEPLLHAGSEPAVHEDASQVGGHESPPPPPAEPAVARASGLSRRRHPDTFMWGPFRLTFSSESIRPPFGQWQATCPYHAVSDKTKCKKSIQLRSLDDKERTRDLLKQWCLAAPNVDRRRRHAELLPRSYTVVAPEVLEARLALLPVPPDPDNLQTDEVLDALESSAAAKAKAKSKAKAKAKATAKGNIRPKSKSSARAEPEASDPGPDEAASDPSSDSDAEASNSNSTESSSSSSSSDDSSS